jgi:hypothetical protein
MQMIDKYFEEKNKQKTYHQDVKGNKLILKLKDTVK